MAVSGFVFHWQTVALVYLKKKCKFALRKKLFKIIVQIGICKFCQ